MSRFIVHEAPISSCSWRLRIGFAFKEIRFESREVDDVDAPEFRKMNPAGQVPVLEIDNQYFIAQSLAILEYLEEVHPQMSLLPQEPLQRAKVREICQLIVSGIQPLQLPSDSERVSDDPKLQEEWTSYYIEKGFHALEEILKGTSADGIHCVGSTFSMADCCLVPQAYNAFERFGVDATPYPTIYSIYTELMKLSYVNSGCPKNMSLV